MPSNRKSPPAAHHEGRERSIRGVRQNYEPHLVANQMQPPAPDRKVPTPWRGPARTGTPTPATPPLPSPPQRRPAPANRPSALPAQACQPPKPCRRGGAARGDMLSRQTAQPARVQPCGGGLWQQFQQAARHVGIRERSSADVVFVHGGQCGRRECAAVATSTRLGRRHRRSRRAPRPPDRVTDWPHSRLAECLNAHLAGIKVQHLGAFGKGTTAW